MPQRLKDTHAGGYVRNHGYNLNVSVHTHYVPLRICEERKREGGRAPQKKTPNASRSTHQRASALNHTILPSIYMLGVAYTG